MGWGSKWYATLRVAVRPIQALQLSSLEKQWDSQHKVVLLLYCTGKVKLAFTVQSEAVQEHCHGGLLCTTMYHQTILQ